MCEREPCATKAPSSMCQELALASPIFQPLNVLPSKIWTKPSSPSAARSAAVAANITRAPVKSVFIVGENERSFLASSQYYPAPLEETHLDLMLAAVVDQGNGWFR